MKAYCRFKVRIQMDKGGDIWGRQRSKEGMVTLRMTPKCLAWVINRGAIGNDSEYRGWTSSKGKMISCGFTQCEASGLEVPMAVVQPVVLGCKAEAELQV